MENLDEKYGWEICMENLSGKFTLAILMAFLMAIFYYNFNDGFNWMAL